MINVDHYDISNIQVINRVLPWWLRGRKTILLLTAIFYPLVMLHKIWMAWALERLIEASTTSQPKSLAWYLNYKLRKHFFDKKDSFAFGMGLRGKDCYIFFMSEWRKAVAYSKPIKFHKEGRDMNITLYHIDEESGSVFDKAKMYSFNLSEWDMVDPMFRCNEGSEEDSDDTMICYNLGEHEIGTNCIIIYAPKIDEENEDYTLEDYRIEILQLALKYITNFQTIIIIYNNERVLD